MKGMLKFSDGQELVIKTAPARNLLKKTYYMKFEGREYRVNRSYTEAVALDENKPEVYEEVMVMHMTPSGL